MTSDNPLRYAVRPRVITHYVGQLSFVLSVFTLVPGTVALLYRDWSTAGWYAGVAGARCGGGLLLRRIDAPRGVQANEGLVVTAFMFLLGPFASVGPLMSAGIGFGDAIFEAISGVTTTGLSTLPSVEGRAPSFLFARAWMQWYGGLGIVVFTLALIAPPGGPAKRLSATEYYQPDLVAGARAFARRALVIYGVLTAVAVAGFLLFGLGPLNAFAYAFASVSTGGFAPDDASLGSYASRGLQAFALGVSFLGAVSFMYYLRVYREGWRALIRRDQFVPLLVLCVAMGGLTAVCTVIGREGPGLARVTDGVLMAVSAQTTAGFSTADLAEWDNSSKLVLIGAMAVGGEIGSTAGGMKIVRLLICLRLIQVLIVRTALPRDAVVKPRLNGVVLREEEVSRALLVMVLVGLVTFASWLPFVAYGYPPLDSLFDVVSATSTVGLSTGVTSSELPGVLKGVLCADMLIGRLEPFAWLVVFAPRTWLGRRSEET